MFEIHSIAGRKEGGKRSKPYSKKNLDKRIHNFERKVGEVLKDILENKTSGPSVSRKITLVIQIHNQLTELKKKKYKIQRLRLNE